jgi:hypothetical protein
MYHWKNKNQCSLCPHHTNAVRQQLHYLFLDKLIGRGARNNSQYSPDITWPPRSPDFNPCDFSYGFYEQTSLCQKSK